MQAMHNPPFLPRVSDRLSELQRQRALAQEQLAWLDREIARESGQAPTAPVPVAPVVPAARPPGEMSADANHAADEIIARYQTPPASTTQDVKRGCFLYFFVALGTVLLVVGAIWLFYIRRK